MIYLKFLTEYYALNKLVSSQITTYFKIQRHLEKKLQVLKVFFLLQKISLIVSTTYLLIEISYSLFVMRRKGKGF